MRIDIHISDATLEDLETITRALKMEAIARTLTIQPQNPAIQKSKPALQKSKHKKDKRVWSKEAIKMANLRTPEAPYGYKMDGTPRKPTGLQKKEK